MNLEKLLNPKNICVVGASEKEGFGGDTCRNILKYMDTDRVFLVNPKRAEVFGIPCYKSIDDIDNTIDLVIICTPQFTVNQILKDAHKKGARGAVGLVSQSGQIALSLMESPNMRFSYAISSGNSSIVKMEQYLDYLIDDEETKVVAMYLEGIKNPKMFEECLRKAAIKRKPIVVLKVGKSEKASQIASSHTGSLAGSDRVYDAVFKKFGVIRVDDIEELLATSHNVISS